MVFFPLCVCVRDLVKNGVVCPGADAEPAALHPRRLLFPVSEMFAADHQPRRLQQHGETPSHGAHIREKVA